MATINMQDIHGDNITFEQSNAGRHLCIEFYEGEGMRPSAMEFDAARLDVFIETLTRLRKELS